MNKRDDGFLRYEVNLVRIDGTSKVIHDEATAHQCTIIQNRFNKTVNMGRKDGTKLRFRVSKVL